MTALFLFSERQKKSLTTYYFFFWGLECLISPLCYFLIVGSVDPSNPENSLLRFHSGDVLPDWPALLPLRPGSPGRDGHPQPPRPDSSPPSRKQTWSQSPQEGKNGLSPGGLRIDGLSLHGLCPDGPSLDGLNGLSPDSLSLHGLSLDGLCLDCISPVGISPDGISPDFIADMSLKRALF